MGVKRIPAYVARKVAAFDDERGAVFRGGEEFVDRQSVAVCRRGGVCGGAAGLQPFEGWPAVEGEKHAPGFGLIGLCADEQRVVYNARLDRGMIFGQIGCLEGREPHVSAHEKVTVLHRIEKAAEYLLRTDNKIYAVAEQVGYRDLDYFINRFISIKGCTPTSYRKKNRNHA